mgnify:CR=1 FL=1
MISSTESLPKLNLTGLNNSTGTSINTTNENVRKMFSNGPTLSDLWKDNGLSVEDDKTTKSDEPTNSDSEETPSNSNDTTEEPVPGWMVFGGVTVTVGLLAALAMRKK